MIVVAGIVAGISLAIGAGYLLKNFIFGVEQYDAAALVGSCGTLLVVSLVAAFALAHRASRLDPILTLKSE